MGHSKVDLPWVHSLVNGQELLWGMLSDESVWLCAPRMSKVSPVCESGVCAGLSSPVQLIADMDLLSHSFKTVAECCHSLVAG